MKKILIGLAAVAMATATFAQEKKFEFKLYGRVRGDLMYNSRMSQESVDGLFYMFPLDKKADPTGADINASPQSNFYMLYTRIGLDMKGPAIGKAKTSAKLETDFRGSGSTYALFRVRQAFVQLDWERHNLLIGQTWHPLYGDVVPSMLNLSTGAPYSPFCRTPMLRYRWKMADGWQLSASTVWQSQYNSPGPENDKPGAASTKHFRFLKHSCVPEVVVGIDYKKDGWLVGVNGQMLSLCPRQTSTVPNGPSDWKTYKVSERVTSFSAEAHVKYTAKMWNASAKTLLGSNLAHLSMLGGYAVSGVDPTTGEQQYTPYRHSSTWVNFVYGKKWQPGLFLGYTKNLGTTKDIAGAGYGVGLDIDQQCCACVNVCYNLPHWKIGVELEPTVAWYGTPDSRGKIFNTHTVTNYRAVAVAMYMF